MPDKPKEFGYREEMPWFGGCYHLWVNTGFYFSRWNGGVRGETRLCKLCGKEEDSTKPKAVENA